MRPRLSIVVPILNEATTLPDLITHLRPLALQGVECIAVDGGSTDGSDHILADWPGAVLVARPGRARQMNAGAAQSNGEVLLFLHADTRLPPGAVDLVGSAVLGRPSAWGRFDVVIEGNARMLAVIACMMNLRSRLSGIATGDQAIFVSRELFETAGGFPDQRLMEDVELSRRLRAIALPICLRERVRTSGRRWETRGVWRTIFLMWRLRWAYWRGASADRLQREYR